MQLWNAINGDSCGGTPRDPAPALRRRYLIGMATIAFLTIAAIVALDGTVAEGHSDGHLVNLAGRQRMLSQRIAKCVLAIEKASGDDEARPYRRQLEIALAQFRDGHAQVVELAGDSDRVTLASSTKDCIQLLASDFDTVENSSRPYIDSASIPAESTTEVLTTAERYLDLMEQIVEDLAEDSDVRVQAHRQLAIEIVVASLVVTVLISLVACEPAVRSVGRAYNSIIDRNALLVDERKKAEQTARSLQESLRFIDAILQTAAEGIIVIDRSGTILLANPAAHRVFAVDAESLVGADITDLMNDFDRVHHHEYVSNYEKTGASSVINSTREVVGRRRSGEEFPMDLSVAVMEWDGRRAYTGILRDISERKAFQRRIAQSEKLESIGRLAAGIAHEINTPLQFIDANTRYLKEAVESLALPETEGETGDDAARRAKVRANIAGAIDDNLAGIGRVSEIVAAMKEFSHPGQKHKSMVSLNDCVSSTVTISQNRWKGVAEVDLQLDPYLPACEAFPAEINQTLLNLVVNAADAIAETQSKADGEHRGLGRITVRTWTHDDAVSVAVEDSGAGVPATLIAKIFDPFFTTKSVGKGTGQGLAIAHDIVAKLHGGTLDVENRPEGGARFVMTIPIVAPETPIEASETEPSPPSSGCPLVAEFV
ncbi:Sensor protein FixL [Botrimarina colliarenosi]|uniref:histidine kinase n=1 Tax=Botrimarina colliarenosi TaxID=2528001 RepID=A0A5C6ACF9_9BACT|nr:PAS domain S-box protein [Botrimarina colliarenosi]TWT97077.1 Sensor protein FixL [Botrimarina colliarenosi]